MHNIFNTIEANYRIDGEDERYADFSDGAIIFSTTAADGDQTYKADEERYRILQAAKDYFKDGVQYHTWYFDDYVVYEEEDTLRFEDNDGDILGYVYKEDGDDLVRDLDNGDDPIADGWEDGVGNTISLSGWLAEHEA